MKLPMYFHGFQFHFVSASAIFILIMFVTIGSHVLPLNYIRSTKRSLSFTFAIGISIHLAYTYIFVHMYHLHRVRRVSIGSCYTCFIQVDFCACLLHLMDLDQSILHSCSTDLFTSCFPQYFQLISMYYEQLLLGTQTDFMDFNTNAAFVLHICSLHDALTKISMFFLGGCEKSSTNLILKKNDFCNHQKSTF